MVDWSIVLHTDSSVSSTLVSGQALYPNGTVVDFGAPADDAMYPTKITDANGNYITITYQGNVGPQIETIQDSLGRIIRFYYDANNLLATITAPGLDGSPRTLVRLHYRRVKLAYNFNPSIPVCSLG
jgi:uncharacterized protein RhaS with RHS repeats